MVTTVVKKVTVSTLLVKCASTASVGLPVNQTAHVSSLNCFVELILLLNEL